MKKIILTSIIFTVFVGCTTTIDIDRDDYGISIKKDNGKMRIYFEGNPYSGIITKHFKDSEKLSKKSEFSNGILNGKSVNYWKNGNIKSNFEYVEGVENGEFEEFYEEGQKKTIGEYISKKKTGEWISYYVNGQIRSLGKYNNNSNKVGEWISYREDGKIDDVEQYNDKGEKSGTWKSFYKNGEIYDEENYLNDKLHGLRTSYDSKGNLNYKGNYIDGKKDGVHVNYANFGNYGDAVEQGNYILGKKDGKHTRTMINGDLVFEEYYKNGELNGPYKRYFYKTKGLEKQIEIEGTYLNGNKYGEWIVYDWSRDKNDNPCCIVKKDYGRYNENGERIGKWIFWEGKSWQVERIY